MEFPSLKHPAIIAMKGLPCTFKTGVATSIACWAGSPILFVDDFLDQLYPQGGGNGNSSRPSEEEAERLLQVAFNMLCKVANGMLGRPNKLKCLVIESRLCFTFELDGLFSLAHPSSSSKNQRIHPLIIIECQMRNKYQWERYFGFDPYQQSIDRWYKPKDWNEVEEANDAYDADCWDSHFDCKIKELPNKKQHLVRKLVLDPYNDLSVNERIGYKMTNPFADVIQYLLTGGHDDLHYLHPVVEFNELRHDRRQLQALSKATQKNPCTNGGCEFEYWKALEKKKTRFCGVCNRKLCSEQVYACRFCSLALHKSCAEDIKMSETAYTDRRPQARAKVKTSTCYNFSDTLHACKSCGEKRNFSYECHSCIFQAHLKCKLLPTIVHHESHPKHFLFIRLSSTIEEDLNYCCKACGFRGYLNSYVCKVCNHNYHLTCIALPREIKHEHGGYDHGMKLMYSLNKEQEDFWCDVCYRDMDPNQWFYSCKECDYVAHTYCVKH